jgi:hypothetical protein
VLRSPALLEEVVLELRDLLEAVREKVEESVKGHQNADTAVWTGLREEEREMNTRLT